MPYPSTRDQIVQAADSLFYEKGFAQTSFADIAKEVGVSRGNFYHHFKTKNDILTEVIALRTKRTRAMLDDWASNTDPKKRISCFIHILTMNRAKIARFGCPVGTLSTELSKLDHSAQGQASALFTLFRDWLRDQFSLLGFSDADAKAMYLLSRSQGAATLAQAFGDEAYLENEDSDMQRWLTAQTNP